jgi:zinc transporter 9
MAQGSKTSVVAAITGNSAVMISKFVVFAISGSSSMLAEAIHTLADLFNQVLLLVGIQRSRRPPSKLFAFGHGQERYFWNLVSACGVFFIGSGVTIYHGVQSLMEQHRPEIDIWTVVVLGAAVVIEGTVLAIAVRAVLRQKGDRSFLAFVRTTTDPTLIAVVLEDSAAVLGLLIAGAGIGLTELTGNPVFDAAGSILVGVLLGLVAIFLANQNRKLLIDQTSPRTEAVVRAVLERHPAVRSIRDLRTVIFAPKQVLLVADLEWAGESVPVTGAGDAPLAEGDVKAVIRRVGAITDDVEDAIRAAAPEVRDIYLEVEQFRGRGRPQREDPEGA